MESHRQKGAGTKICKQLVELSLANDPSARITKRTLPEKTIQQGYWRKTILS